MIRAGTGRLPQEMWKTGLACLVTLATVLAAPAAKAACSTPNNTSLSVHLPDYPLWRGVAQHMMQCGNVTVEYGFDAATVEPDPGNPDRNLGSLVGISNASLYRLASQKLLRPLDDLAERYKVLLHPRQLIRQDGRVIAIAVAANTKAMTVHRELLVQEGIGTPKTYDGLIEAVEKLKATDSRLFEVPLTLAYKPGWNLTQEFIDLFLGAGGSLFGEAGKPSVSTEKGIAALEQMKKLAAYLPKEARERDAATVLNDLMRFTAPMSVTWVSSVGPLDNPAVSRVAGKMQILPAPAIGDSGKPAATLWWEGFAIPVSATEEEAEAAFLTALEGLDEDMLAEHGWEALWLVKDFQPGHLAKDVLAAIDAGIEPYPDSQALNLLRRALNDQIEAVVFDNRDPASALKRAEADYMKAARELGLPGF